LVHAGIAEIMSCATCRFWERYPNRPNDGICGLANYSKREKTESKAYAEADGMEWDEAYLVTKPDFHCNQFAEHEPPKLS